MTLDPDPKQQVIWLCATPEATIAIAEIWRRHDGKWSQEAADVKGDCIGSLHGTRLTPIAESTVAIVANSYQVVQVQFDNYFDTQSKPKYVLKRNLVPLTYQETQPAIGPCGPALGGEVDRWVISADGTLKLKRFMITSRCVNGQMRSFTKPLN